MGLKTFPATLNNISTGAVDAGIPKTHTTTVLGLCLDIYFMHLKVLISTFFIKYLSTSTNASRQQILESISKHFKISACPMSVTYSVVGQCILCLKFIFSVPYVHIDCKQQNFEYHYSHNNTVDETTKLPPSLY